MGMGNFSMFALSTIVLLYKFMNWSFFECPRFGATMILVRDNTDLFEGYICVLATGDRRWFLHNVAATEISSTAGLSCLNLRRTWLVHLPVYLNNCTNLLLQLVFLHE
jgi:hypothetical protein